MKSSVNKIVICSLGVIVFLFVCCGVTAQQRRVIKLYKSSGIVESMPVSFLDSIRFEYENIPAIDIDNPSISEDIEEYNKRMQWWNDARYGMFIHYGLYSVLAGEYEGKNLKGEDIKFQSYGPLNTIGNGVTRGGGAGSEWILYEAYIPRAEYKKYTSQFYGTNWNPKEIVSMAVKCGFKYIVLTAKHHEGFCLWDSEATDFDIASTPAGELWNGDMIAPLAEETRKAGLKFGLYFSHALDWTHEGGLGDIPELDRKQYSLEEKRNYMNKYTYPMLKELIIRYNPDIIWWDIPSANPYEEFAEGCLDILKEYASSDIIQDDRLSTLEGYRGDYKTLEQNMNENTAVPNGEWCMSLNYSWGYNQYDNSYKESGYVLYSLLRCAKVGVNMLMNIGPTGDGSVLSSEMDYRLEFKYTVYQEVGSFITIYKNGWDKFWGVNPMYIPQSKFITNDSAIYYGERGAYTDYGYVDNVLITKFQTEGILDYTVEFEGCYSVDEIDLSKVHLDLELFEAYTEGYLSEMADYMTEDEVCNMGESIKIITFELALRFLNDYINGDTYFKVNYENPMIYGLVNKDESDRYIITNRIPFENKKFKESFWDLVLIQKQPLF